MIAAPTLMPSRYGAWTIARADTRAARVYVALVLLAVLPYLNALQAGFTLDDEPQIWTNPAVTQGVDVIRVLSTPLFPGDLYRPFTIFTFSLNHYLPPVSSAAFHAVNVLLHAMVTLLVFFLARRLFQASSVAYVAAALFAIHPLHTEAVTSLVGRAEELAALFGLMTLLSAARMDRTRDPWSRRAWHFLSVLSFTFGIMSKESGLTFLPLVLLLRPALRGESLWRGLWTEIRSLDWVPYALCAALFLKLRFYVNGGLGSLDTVSPLESMLPFVPAALRIRTALSVLWDYVGLMHVPLVLAADYSTAQVPIVTSAWGLRCLGGAIAVVAAIATVLLARRRTLAFAAALPLVTLSLTSNLLFAIGTVKAERLLYTPSIGWALLAGVVFDWGVRRPRYSRATALALTLVCGGFAVRTWVRNWDWQDNTSLYRSAAASSPNSAKARYNYAVALQGQGMQEAALAHFTRALELYPWSEGAAFGSGIAYEKLGRSDVAIGWYERALSLAPAFGRAHTNLCHVLYENGHFAEAARACRDGLRYDPTDANLLKGFGASLIEIGEEEMGMEVLQRAVRLAPGDTQLQAFVASLATRAASRTGGTP